MRRILCVALAFAAALLALIPFVGRWSPTLDALASFLPLAAPLAIAALLLNRRAPATALLAGAALIVTLSLVAAEWWAGPKPAQAEGEQLVIVTHNLWDANTRPESTANALIATGADILLLQEYRGASPATRALLARHFPFHSGCRTTCDLAIYSRLPMDRPRWRFRDMNDEPFGPPLLWGRVHLPGGETATVISIHQPWPVPGAGQQENRRALVSAIGQMDDPRLILAGDFNLTPWGAGMAELDDGMPQLRRVTRALFSFPARTGHDEWPVPVLPIDHVFVGRGWSPVDVERLGRTGSDHYPVRAVLALRQAASD